MLISHNTKGERWGKSYFARVPLLLLQLCWDWMLRPFSNDFAFSFLIVFIMQTPRKNYRICAVQSVKSWCKYTPLHHQPQWFIASFTSKSQEQLLPLTSCQWSCVLFQSPPHSQNTQLLFCFQNSQSVEHLLYLTLPSERYRLRLCLGIMKATSRITRH